MRRNKISGSYTPTLHLECEACSCGGMHNNLGQLGTINIHRNLDARVFLFFPSTRKAATAVGMEPASFS